MKRAALFRIYAFRFASGFVPIMQLYTVLFAEDQLSTLEISVLVAAWSVAALLFEVPSGVVADKFDRRYVLGASQLLCCAAFLLWLAFPHFWGYLIGFVIWGIGGAMDSGTYEALVYDELAEAEQSNRFVDVLGRSEALYLFAIVGGSAFAALFVDDGYSPLLWASAATAVVGALIAASLPKAARREEVEDDEYFSLLKRGIKSSFRTPMLAKAIAAIALTGCATDLVSEYAPLFASDRALAASGVAIVGAVAVLVMAGASAFAARLPGASLPSWVHLSVAGALIVTATVVPTWPAIVLFNLSAAIANASSVLARGELQKHVEGDIRATTTSVGGFVQELLNVASLLAVGIIADATTRTTAFRYVGITVIAAALLMAVSARAVSPPERGEDVAR